MHIFNRLWRMALPLAVVLLTIVTQASAQEPAPDRTGAFQSVPNRTSLPEYAAPKDSSNPSAEEMSPKTLVANQQAIAQSVSHNYYSINYVWVLLCGFLVMFMQAGFALLETGLCRAKNAAHTMSMNFMVYALGITGFFICGFAFMCGGASGTAIGGPASLGGVPTLNQMLTVGSGWGIIGKTGFLLSGSDTSAAVWFLFMMVFLDTAATIPTGAAAERWSFKSFFIFSLLVGAWIYPIFGCWVWGGGWLAQLGLKAGIAHGAVDYAGSGVVHLQGGTLALVLAWMLGPRLGKYDSNGNVRPILGHHVPMVMLGTFILAFGWFGFNAGSSLSGNDGRIGIVAANTMLASAAGAIATCLYMWFFIGKPDPSMMCNGMLAGLVAITASCAYVTPAAAFFIGLIAGVLVVWSVFFWDRAGIDDPVGAISIHAVNGLWGLVALGLFADGSYGIGKNACHLFKLADGSLRYFNNLASAPAGAVEQGVTGMFYGNPSQLLAQLIEAGASIAWNLINGVIIIWVIGKALGGNRVPAEVEIAGLDIPEMGAPGYPEFIEAIAPEQVPLSEVAAAQARL